MPAAPGCASARSLMFHTSRKANGLNSKKHSHNHTHTINNCNSKQHTIGTTIVIGDRQQVARNAIEILKQIPRVERRHFGSHSPAAVAIDVTARHRAHDDHRRHAAQRAKHLHRYALECVQHFLAASRTRERERQHGSSTKYCYVRITNDNNNNNNNNNNRLYRSAGISSGRCLGLHSGHTRCAMSPCNDHHAPVLSSSTTRSSTAKRSALSRPASGSSFGQCCTSTRHDDLCQTILINM
jgi:hypothetical protein